jgi:hypothetical protein
LPDPAKLDERSLKALLGLLAELGWDPAIYNDAALEDRVDAWHDAVIIKCGRRPWASHAERKGAELLAKQRRS